MFAGELVMAHAFGTLGALLTLSTRERGRRTGISARD